MDMIEQLEEGLNKLTGADLIDCDNIERSRGNITPIISMSMNYQLRIAAIALKTQPQDLEILPARQLQRILLKVNNFLLGDLDAEEITLKKSEE